MKKIYLLIFTVFAFTANAFAQISVSGGSGLAATYSSLTNAGGLFAAINATPQTGNNIVVSVTGDVFGETGLTSLNAGAWTTINITPSGARTVSGAPATGVPLINLNGADNVTINGLNTGGNSFTISNTTIAATAMTIRFLSDASNNIITNCTILGSSTSTMAIAAGTIVFSVGSVTGNDNNTISNNNIGPAGSNLPSKAIMASGTSAVIENDNNTITGNNIFDYFIATTSHSGINILTGNEGWTISNNRFYQTATRTFTAPTLRHSAITLNNTTGAFTVSGNIIGFGTSAGTGTTTITGSSNEFRGIDAASVSTTVATNLQNNIISGINQTSSRASTTQFTGSIFIGFVMGTTSGLINATGNTIGSLDASSTVVINATTTTANVSPVFCFLNSNITGNNINISNNNIGSITINSGGTGTTTGFYGIFISIAPGLTATVNNNTIGGTAAGSITNNIVGSIGMYAIQVAGPNLIATGNIIRNMTGNSTASGLYASCGFMVSGATGISTISGNIIHSLTNNAGSANCDILGMVLSFPATANIIEGNFIHSLTTNASVANGQIVGIYTNQGSGTYKNNMIRLGVNAAGVTNTLGNFIVGIWHAAFAANNNFYHNSVYIGGSGVTGVNNTYAFYSTLTGVTRDHRNNIFWNARSNGSGTNVNAAITVGGSAPNPAGLTSNYNDLYATGAGGVTGVFNGTNYTTLANWQTATGQDANSFAQNPHFVNKDGAAAVTNLHVLSLTPIEAAGVNIPSVTNDFDGQLRTGLTPADVGADAENFTNGIPDDIVPAITYTNVPNQVCATANPVLLATITDAAGINITSGTKPRIFFKKSTNSNALPGTNDNTTNGWKYTEATNSVNPFQLTIDMSLIFGGVSSGDNIQYFVTAQDLAFTPNVGINSGTFAATPASVALTGTAFPVTGTINNFNMVLPVPTAVTIGATGTYTSLTGAGGLFEAINTLGITANITATIIDASVTETGANALNQMVYNCGAGPYSLTIKPNAPGTVLTGSFDNGALVKIKSNNVIIDGSFNGTASRDLSIINNSLAVHYVLHIASTGIIPVTNTTVKNCIVDNGSMDNSFAIVVSDDAGLATPGYFSDIALTNNSIRKTLWGIYCNAVAASGNGNGLDITANILDNAGINAIKSVGIYIAGVDGATISGNAIGNFELISAGTDCGIWLNTGTANTIVEKNNIHDLGYLGGVGFGGKAIMISTGLANANVTVKNNMIYGIIGDGDSYTTYGAEFDPVGIYAYGSGQGGIYLYYNSIYLSGATINFSADAYSIGIALDDNTTATIKNNIVKNELGLLGSIGVGAVGIAAETSASQFTSLDHNDYYSLAVLGSNLIGKLGATDYATLTAWQTATGQEANSLNVQPDFVSATDLHLIANTNCGLDGYGTPIAGITTDYDDQTREVTTPDMGADEFTATYPVTLAGITGSAVCENKNVSLLGTTYTNAVCDLIARVLPSGGSAVSGKINVCVTLDATPQSFNGEPYVQRHHDIEPVNTPATATATITLYYTNTEFINYNTANPVWPALPTFAGDPKIANVRITQFHGTPTGGLPTTTPGNYTGTRVLIDPLDANITYNAGIWTVTFNVTGFSGFYLHTTLLNTPLPVMVNYLNGRKQAGNHLLDWKVTCVSTPRATMTLERSSDARNFSGIYTITADATRCNSPFDYTDANPLIGMNYYRLKIVDADGKITYSTTVALLNAVKGFEIISIAPNPVVNDHFKLNVTSARASKMNISIFDMQGRLVNSQTVTVIAGYNSLPLNISDLSYGTYTIQARIADERSKVARFVKQ